MKHFVSQENKIIEMKRKKYLQTKFIKFLIENEKQSENENDDIIDEVENDDLDADEIIEHLIQKQKNVSQEYDDIIYGRK